MAVQRLLFVALVIVSVSVAQKKPFAIADLYSIPGVDDPQLSPDGKCVAFVVTETTLEKGTSNSDIYLMESDGKNPRRLTHHPATDNCPRWSPDGSRLLFVSTRAQGSQLWSLALTGGEPEQLTTLSTGASNPVWSPDGRTIAFESAVFPECGADDACNKRIGESLSSGPVQAYMADRLLYRHWTSWRQGKRSHILVLDLERRTIRDLTPGDFDAPPFSLGEPGYAFSPDGSELCFVSSHDPHEAETTNKDLFLVPVKGGDAVNITSSNGSYDGTPSYSPDGRYIAYRLQTVPGFEADRFRLAVWDRTTRQTSDLTKEFDFWVNSFQWAPDSRSLYFTADTRGHVPLYRVDLKTGKPVLILDHKTIDAFSVGSDNRTIVYSRRSVGEPREIWRVAAGGGIPQRLTFFTKPVADAVDIRPAEELWIPSPTGKTIHTFLVKPHGFDPRKKYPLILNVHGGPQMQWADAFRGDWQVYPGAGYIVAFPNPHGSTGYGQEFTNAISRDWGGKVYEDVMAVTDSLARIGWVDADRMGAMGWSYGGTMMMWLEGHTKRFKAIASMMGVYNLSSMYGATEELWFPEYDLGGTPWESDLYQKWSPSQYVKNFATPCLVITGERDYRVPYTQSLEFFTALQKQRVPSRLIVFKNDGHWPSSVKSMPLYYNAHLDWFHLYLGGGQPPYDTDKLVRNQVFDIPAGNP